MVWKVRRVGALSTDPLPTSKLFPQTGDRSPLEYGREILDPLPINRHPKGLINNHNGGRYLGITVLGTQMLQTPRSDACSMAVTPKERLMLPSPEPTRPRSPDTQSHTTCEVLNCSCKTMALLTFSEAPRKQRTRLEAPSSSQPLGGAGGQARRRNQVPFCSGCP